MIAMTTSSSISVKPCRKRRLVVSMRVDPLKKRDEINRTHPWLYHLGTGSQEPVPHVHHFLSGLRWARLQRSRRLGTTFPTGFFVPSGPDGMRFARAGLGFPSG